MKVHRELKIRGSQQLLRQLPDAVERKLSDGWSRVREREADLRRNSAAELFCFHWAGDSKLPAADVWLVLRDTELRVSNVVPSPPKTALNYAEYNDILEGFARKYAAPVAVELGLAVTLTNPDIAIQDVLPPEVASALVEFSQSANRQTGASDPLDKQRWEAFVIGAHRSQADLDAVTLSRWLIEEEKWPPAAALDLAIEYEQARSILEQYDRQMQNV